MTTGTDGVSAIPHPDRADAQVLALRKPKADSPAGASHSFPFGVQGHLTMRLRLEPGSQGATICLTDFFSLPGHPEAGRFHVGVMTPVSSHIPRTGDEPSTSVVTLAPGQWHTLGFAWDCGKGTCKLSVDYRPVADLPQLSDGPGVCYLRLRSAAEKTDEAGMLVESVATKATAW